MKTSAYKYTEKGLKHKSLTCNLPNIAVEDNDNTKKYVLGEDLIRIKWSVDLHEIHMTFELNEPKQINFKGEINELAKFKKELDAQIIYSGFKYFYEDYDFKHTCHNKLTNTKYHYEIMNFGDDQIHCMSTSYGSDLLKIVKKLNQSQSDFLLKISEIYIEDNNTLILVYENYEKELRSYISKPLIQDTDFRINVITQLLQCVQTLHNLGIIHRNLTLTSFKVQNGQVKLSGFDLSLLQDDNQHFVQRCGTPGMIAPEIYQGYPYSEQSDIYSLGVIIHLCLTGKHVFPHDVPEMIQCNKMNNYQLSQELNNSPVFKQMIHQMMKENCNERITLQQCVTMIQQ